MFGNNQQQGNKPTTTFGTSGAGFGFGTGSSNAPGGSGFGGAGATGVTPRSIFGGSTGINSSTQKPLTTTTTTTMTPFSLNKPQTQTSNLFGTSTATPAPTTTSTGFSLQPSTTTSQQQSNIFSSPFSLAPCTENSINTIRSDTKFHQLPESARKRLIEMAKEIERHKEVMMSIDNSWPDVKETIRSTENTARNVEQHIHGLTEKLDASRRLINDLCQSLVRQKVYHDSARDASLSTSDTVFQKYLRDTILSMEERIEQYDQNIEELDRHISAIINATQGEVRPNAITETMRLQHEIFMVVTGKVATIHESVDKLRKEYLEFLRMTGDMSNPFVESDVAGGKDVSLPSYIASHALPESTTQTASGANTTTTGFNMFN